MCYSVDKATAEAEAERLRALNAGYRTQNDHVDAKAESTHQDVLVAEAEVELLQARLDLRCPGWDCVCSGEGYCDFCNPQRALAAQAEE